MYYRKVTDARRGDGKAKQDAEAKQRADIINKLGLTPEQIKHFAKKNEGKPKIIKNEIGNGKKRIFP